MSTPEDKKRIPEWSIFDRLDEVEEITLKLMEKADTTEPTLKEMPTLARDAFSLALNSLIFSFGAAIQKHPQHRLIKDQFISILKEAGLSEDRLNSVEALLLLLCEQKEKRRKQVT